MLRGESVTANLKGRYQRAGEVMLSQIYNLKRRIFSKLNVKRKVWNRIIDHCVSSITEKEIKTLCNTYILDLPVQNFWQWLSNTLLPFRTEAFAHKKALEFFFSATILQPQPHDHIMDAAGGRSDYLDMIKKVYGCRNVYLADHIYPGVTKNSDGLTVVGGDISEIRLPDSTLTKISCHHAFEHFQGGKDLYFIREIGRLLKHGGRACIIPLFLADRYVECWNIDHQAHFDVCADLIVDKSSSIPGADDDSHFARIYSTEAFKSRIIATAKDVNLRPFVVTCRLDGNNLPDMEKNFGTKLNCPLRALVLEKNG
jgi:SAM-dependent methyltransferase